MPLRTDQIGTTPLAANHAADHVATNTQVNTNTTAIASLTTTVAAVVAGAIPDATTLVKGKAYLGATGGAATFESDAGKQPLDADLTAIAAVSTAAYGRSLLALADAAAARATLGVGLDTLAAHLAAVETFTGAHTFDAGAFLDKGNEVYNVKAAGFGAVGDGVADDTAAIKLAVIAAGSAGGGTVYLPAGTYRIATNSAIAVQYTNVCIQGAGRGVTTMLSDYDGTAVGGNIGLFTFALTTSGAIDNCRVSDMSFNLNNKKSAAVFFGSPSNGNTGYGSNYRLENVEIYGRCADASGSFGAVTIQANYGAYYTGGIRGLKFKNVEIRDGNPTSDALPNGTSILMLVGGSKSLDNPVFENVYIHDTYGPAISKLTGTSSLVTGTRAVHNMVIDRGFFVNAPGTNPLTGVASTATIYDSREGFDGLKIINSHFEGGYGAHDLYCMAIYQSKNFIVSDTTFKDVQSIIAPGHSFPYGSESVGWLFSDNVVFHSREFADGDGHYTGEYTGNVLINVEDGGVFGGYGRQYPRIMSSNLFYNCCTDPTSGSGEIGYGIFKLEQGGNVVTDNTIYNDYAQSAPSAPTVAINVTSGLLNGAYLYRVTLVSDLGETDGGTVSASVAPANQQVNLTNIPLGLIGTKARKIYRTAAGGGAGTTKYVGTVYGNSTTTFTDNLADASLGADCPTVNQLVNNMKYVFAEINADGTTQLPNVYRDNTILGAGANTRTFLLDDNIRHVIEGNVGVTETTIRTDYHNSSVSVGALSTSDHTDNNISLTGTYVGPVIKIADKLGLGGNTSPASDIGIGSVNLGTFNGIGIGKTADTDLRLGQDSTHNAILSWKYNATVGSAYATLETYGGSNLLGLQTSGGNLAIGRTTASNNVSIGTVDLGSFTGIGMGYAATHSIRFGQDSTHNLIMGWNYNATANNAYVNIETYGGTNVIGLQTAGGKVAIGKTTAGTALDIVGTITATGAAINGTLTMGEGNNAVLGTATGTMWGTSPSHKQAWWAATPIVQPAHANQAAITDSTGGTAGFTLADVTATPTQTLINNNFASLNRQMDAIRTALVTAGIIKGAA
jgi:hypothetical protein